MASTKVDLKDKLDALAILFANLLEECTQEDHKVHPLSDPKSTIYESQDTTSSQTAVGLRLPATVNHVSSNPSPAEHR
jgi:hypothetical protein